MKERNVNEDRRALLNQFEIFLESLPQDSRKQTTLFFNRPANVRSASVQELSKRVGVDVDDFQKLSLACGLDSYNDFRRVFLGDNSAGADGIGCAESRIPGENSLISIIIPAFNACDTIEATILSTLAQTYDPVEVVVVDDGSEDNTIDIVGRLQQQDSRVRIVKQSNYGVATARNSGIRNALGEYVAFLDADDLWHPEKISLQLQQLVESRCEFVYSPFRVIDKKSKVLWTPPFFNFTGNARLAMLQSHLSGNGSSIMCSRELAVKVGGFDERLNDRGLQGCEDFLFAAKAAACADVTCAPWFLIGLRKLKDSMSSNTEQMIKSREHAIQIIAEEGELPIPAKVMRWSRGSSSAPQFINAMTEFKPLLAGRTLISGILNDPLVFASVLIGMLRRRLQRVLNPTTSLPFHCYDFTDGPSSVPSRLIARRLDLLKEL